MSGAPLESSYAWPTPVGVATVGLVLCLGLLVRTRPSGWAWTAVVLFALWAGYIALVWLRTRAFLQVDGPVLVVRRFRGLHRVRGTDLVRVRESLTPSGASYVLTVRTDGGRLVTRVAPTALLQRGHSTLFTWILTSAPQAELDKGSRRTLEDLHARGLVDRPAP